MKLVTTLKSVLAALVFLVGLSLPAFADMKLVMVEEDGCMWCARWNEDVSEIYPKTPEGKAAPLVRMDIKGNYPEGMTFDRPLYFTPTFVLMVDGQEASRIEGYPGEDFFWGLLGQMIEKAKNSKEAAG